MKWLVAQPLIGGMSLGFEEAFGCYPDAIITAGFANDDHYINYQNSVKNKNIPVIRMDTSYDEFLDKESENLFNKLKSEGVDCLMHVAVCAGLSMLNSSSSGSKARGDADNDQNQNMYQLTRLGMKLDSKVVVFENAPAAYTKSGADVIEKLRNIADEFDYSTHLLKTDTILHGIPQSRKRTFVSFYKNSNAPEFEYEHTKTPELSNYLDKLVEVDCTLKDHFINPEFDIWHEFILSEGFSTLQEAKDIIKKRPMATSQGLVELVGFEKASVYFENRFKETGDIKYQKGAKTALHCKAKRDIGKSYWDSSDIIINDGKNVNAIIGKNMSSIIHPSGSRKLNTRELMFLMGMPNDFDIDAKSVHRLTQNVPTCTSRYVGDQIKKYLNNELLITDSNFVKQNNEKGTRDL